MINLFLKFTYSLFKQDGPEREKYHEQCKFFYDIDDKSNDEIVKLIQSHSLDIVIDLAGYTKLGKPEIFNSDIAKIKINYLDILEQWVVKIMII